MFWKYMDSVMDDKSTGRVKSIDGLFGIAGEVGLSRAELRLMFNSVDDVQRERFTALVQSVTDDVNVARKLEIRMTPTFIVYAEGVEPKVVPANMLDMTLMQAPFRQIIEGN